MKKHVAIFDIDGTLTLDPAFPVDNCMGAVVNPAAPPFANALSKEWEIVYLTGRWEKERECTERWLKENNFPKGELDVAKGYEDNNRFSYDEHFYDKLVRLEERIIDYEQKDILVHFFDDSITMLKYVQDALEWGTAYKFDRYGIIRFDRLDKVLRANRWIEGVGHFIEREDERIEWICPHGVGHTVYSPTQNYVHGCDGCCDKYGLTIVEDYGVYGVKE